jgi:hypothetical protein
MLHSLLYTSEFSSSLANVFTLYPKASKSYKKKTFSKLNIIKLENSDVYNRECNIDDAWIIIDKFSRKLTVLENEAQVQM